MADKVSTSALAKAHHVSSKELFALLQQRGWINRLDEQWVLTSQGRKQGGEYRNSEKFGRYIVWPTGLELDNGDDVPAVTEVDIFVLAELSGVEISTLNLVLAEVSAQKQGPRGWFVTPLGLSWGAVQHFDEETGIPAVFWPAEVLDRAVVRDWLKALRGDLDQAMGLTRKSRGEWDKYIGQYPANYRCTDGRMVRNRGEMQIANWLYLRGIVWAYERPLAGNDALVADFWLPEVAVAIEYWALPSDVSYQAMKSAKIAEMKSLGVNVIEIREPEVAKIELFLAKALLPFGLDAF